MADNKNAFDTAETPEVWKQNLQLEKADPTEHQMTVERPRQERKRKKKQNKEPVPMPTEPTGNSAFIVSTLDPLCLVAIVLLG